MADFATSLRAAVLFVGWPGMVLVSAFVVWNSWRFYQKVQRSAFGLLVFLMVVGWTLTMGLLAVAGTWVLQQDPSGAGPWAAAFLAFWAATMAMVVWIVHRWGAEAVTINLYYAELASMDRIKSQLINTVAHELTTPLTPILLKFSMLQRDTFGPLSKAQREAIASIERNLGRLQVLVEQVVLALQLQTGQVHLRRQAVAAQAWTREVVARFAPQATDERRPFEVQADDVRVEMDASRMDRVLAALVSNALRHSPPGSPVRVVARTVGDDWVVEVTDQGSGFTAEQGAVLFEPFRHARDPAQDVHAGAGLSLYIARGIVGLHGGRVWGLSQGPGQGASFGFSVPLRTVPSDVAPAAALPRDATT